MRLEERVRYMQAGVGQFGVFAGKRWNNEIDPMLPDFGHVKCVAGRVFFSRIGQSVSALG